MLMKRTLKPLAAALGTTFVVALAASPIANATDNPFSLTEISGGYMVADKAEGKCGEGKCGGAKAKDTKETEGKCGGAKAKDTKETEGKCGEGKCGGAKAKDTKETEGKCGEGKCGGEKSREAKDGGLAIEEIVITAQKR